MKLINKQLLKYNNLILILNVPLIQDLEKHILILL